MRGRRWILPVMMTALAIAALVFAIVATKESKKADPGTVSTGTSATSTATQPLTRGGFAGAELPRPSPAPAISLTDQYSRPVSLASFRGEPVLLTFLYT